MMMIINFLWAVVVGRLSVEDTTRSKPPATKFTEIGETKGTSKGEIDHMKEEERRRGDGKYKLK
uniref:Uncharacterized protein n=1 Tax=Arundo donax TaxID=35708 RepID=A0A0A9E6E8_ARUDO